MSRPPVFPMEQKTRIVLSILAGEITVAEAARQYKVSEQLEREVEELKAALGEATVELRVWKKSAEYLAPSRTSR